MQQLWRKSDEFFGDAYTQPFMPSIVDNMPSPETLIDWTSKIDMCISHSRTLSQAATTSLLDSLVAILSRASFAVIYALVVSYAMRKHAFLKSAGSSSNIHSPITIVDGSKSHPPASSLTNKRMSRKQESTSLRNNRASLNLVEIAKIIQQERVFMTTLRRPLSEIKTRNNNQQFGQFVFPTCMAQWLDNIEIAAPSPKLVSAWGPLRAHRRTLVHRLLNHALSFWIMQRKAEKLLQANTSIHVDDQDSDLVHRMHWQSLYRRTQLLLTKSLQDILGLEVGEVQPSVKENPLSLREWSCLMLGKAPE
jgi:hypothetical protein